MSKARTMQHALAELDHALDKKDLSDDDDDVRCSLPLPGPRHCFHARTHRSSSDDLSAAKGAAKAAAKAAAKGATKGAAKAAAKRSGKAPTAKERRATATEKKRADKVNAPKVTLLRCPPCAIPHRPRRPSPRRAAPRSPTPTATPPHIDSRRLQAGATAKRKRADGATATRKRVADSNGDAEDEAPKETPQVPSPLPTPRHPSPPT